MQRLDRRGLAETLGHRGGPEAGAVQQDGCGEAGIVGGDAEARMEVEAELRRTNELVAKIQNAPAETGTLMDGSVISLKEEWSLVVGNIGEKQGVKMGMPMRVMRGEKLIATLRVVDVRQRICGAVIQKMGSEKEKIKVGDRLQADARKNVTLK